MDCSRFRNFREWRNSEFSNGDLQRRSEAARTKDSFKGIKEIKIGSIDVEVISMQEKEWDRGRWGKI